MRAENSYRLIRDLTQHEVEDLEEDFGFTIGEGAYALTLVNKAEWNTLNSNLKRRKNEASKK